MARRRQFVDREVYLQKVAEGVALIKNSIGDYSHKVRIVSALDGAINFTWGKAESPVKVKRDRFPSISGSTPDFMFEFSNGYRVIGEYKKNWRAESANDLKQLANYKTLTFESTHEIQNQAIKSPTSHDVLLVIGIGQDELACEAISEYSGLGSGSIVVTEAAYLGQAVSREAINFVYRKHGGINGVFASPNAGPADTDYDLNKWFVKGRSFPARCDAEAILAAGECPFVNDQPPPAYSITEVILPLINSLLSESDRDQIATSNGTFIDFTILTLASQASEKYPRVPQGKLQSWIGEGVKELVKIGFLEIRNSLSGDRAFRLYFDDKTTRFTQEKFVQRLARFQVSGEFVPYRVDNGDSQFAFDYEAMTSELH